MGEQIDATEQWEASQVQPRSTHHAEPKIRSRLPPRMKRLVVIRCFR